MQEEIYTRQKKLKLTIPQKAIVVGCGGIGSWIAIDLALVGVSELILIDHDTIEVHNLNRTLFKFNHVGLLKVSALMELILERRPDIEVKVYPCKWQEVDIDTTDYLVFDCRDTIRPVIENSIKIGYDGLNFTIDILSGKNVFGESNRGYTVIPSFFGTPQIVSAIVVSYIVNNRPLPFIANKNILELV